MSWTLEAKGTKCVKCGKPIPEGQHWSDYPTEKGLCESCYKKLEKSGGITMWTKTAIHEEDSGLIESVRAEIAAARKTPAKGPFDWAGTLVNALYDFDYSTAEDLKPLVDAKIISQQEAILVNEYLDQGWEISPSSVEQAQQINENIRKNMANPNWPQGGVGPFGGPPEKGDF
jgi:hypothetical protein